MLPQHVIYSLRAAERPRYRKYVRVDATDVTLPSYYTETRPVSPVCLLLDTLLAFLDSGPIDHYILNIRECVQCCLPAAVCEWLPQRVSGCHRYVGLLYEVASLGNPERQCLLEREAVARIVKFYNTGRSDRTNVRCRLLCQRDGMVLSLSCVTASPLCPCAEQSTLLLEQSFTRAAQIIDVLVRSCRTGSAMGHPPNNVGGCVLVLSERSRNKIMDETFMVSVRIGASRCCHGASHATLSASGCVGGE